MIRALRFVAFAALTGFFGAVALLAILIAWSIHAEATEPVPDDPPAVWVHELFPLCHELGGIPIEGYVVLRDAVEDLSHQCTIKIAPAGRLWIGASDLLLETHDGRPADLTFELADGAVLEIYGTIIDAGKLKIVGTSPRRGVRARAWIKWSELAVDHLRVGRTVELVTTSVVVGVPDVEEADHAR